MHVVLVDLIAYGHHQIYMEIFIRLLLDKGCTVTALYSDPDKIIDWANKNLSRAQRQWFHADKIQVLHRRGLRSMHFHTLNRWLAVRRSIRRIGVEPDLVFFTWVDDFRFDRRTGRWSMVLRKIVEQLVPWQWAGLYFHPLHLRIKEYMSNNNGIDPDAIFRMKNCIAVALLDEGVRESLSQRIHRPVLIFPDFSYEDIVVSPTVLQEIAHKANGRRVVSLLGALQRRKGLLDFIEIIRRMDSERFFFVIAGTFFLQDFSHAERDEIRSLIDSGRENLFVYDGFMSDQYFESLIAASDIIYAVYRDFPHSSNLLTKAAMHGKPLVVSSRYCMGERVLQANLGQTVEEGVLESIIEGIKNLSDVTPPGDYSAYANRHSIPRLSNELDALLALVSR